MTNKELKLLNDKIRAVKENRDPSGSIRESLIFIKAGIAKMRHLLRSIAFDPSFVLTEEEALHIINKFKEWDIYTNIIQNRPWPEEIYNIMFSNASKSKSRFFLMRLSRMLLTYAMNTLSTDVRKQVVLALIPENQHEVNTSNLMEDLETLLGGQFTTLAVRPLIEEVWKQSETNHFLAKYIADKLNDTGYRLMKRFVSENGIHSITAYEVSGNDIFLPTQIKNTFLF